MTCKRDLKLLFFYKSLFHLFSSLIRQLEIEKKINEARGQAGADLHLEAVSSLPASFGTKKEARGQVGDDPPLWRGIEAVSSLSASVATNKEARGQVGDDPRLGGGFEAVQLGLSEDEAKQEDSVVMTRV